MGLSKGDTGSLDYSSCGSLDPNPWCASSVRDDSCRLRALFCLGITVCLDTKSEPEPLKAM